MYPNLVIGSYCLVTVVICKSYKISYSKNICKNTESFDYYADDLRYSLFVYIKYESICSWAIKIAFFRNKSGSINFFLVFWDIYLMNIALFSLCLYCLFVEIYKKNPYRIVSYFLGLDYSDGYYLTYTKADVMTLFVKSPYKSSCT